MPRAEALGVRYSQAEGRVVERGDSYAVTCDCQAEKELKMGGKSWTHDCPSYGYSVVIQIDRDGHMTVEHP